MTGAPGSGKTAILHRLSEGGYATVAEAATDVIASEQLRGVDQPWLDAGFIDQIVDLQLRRFDEASDSSAPVQIHDRSVFCTLALAEYAGWAPSHGLLDAIERASRNRCYEDRVFFIRSLGFVTPTEARRITYEGALKFERLHEDVYRRYGFRLIDIPAAPLAARVDRVVAELRRDGQIEKGRA